jgi:hypothetical protein
MNINNQLGIPTMLHEYDNFTHIDQEHANAGGRQRRQERRAERKENRQERRAERKENRQERRQERREGRNTQRVTDGDRRAAEDWVMNSFGKQLLEAKDIETIDYWAGVMADQKVDMEMMLGKRKSGVGNVVSFGRQYKRRGKNAGLCTSDGCIRQSQARLDALNQFEVKHNTAINTLRKKYEKLTEEKPLVSDTTSTSKTTTSGNVSPQVGAATFPTGALLNENSGTSNISTDETDKNKVNVGGQQINKSTLIFGAFGLAIAGFLIYKFK